MRCQLQAGCKKPAEVWLVGPTGLRYLRMCRAHGETVIAAYKLVLRAVWRLETLKPAGKMQTPAAAKRRTAKR